MIQEALRKAIESTYTDSCTVSERRKEINPVTNATNDIGEIALWRGDSSMTSALTYLNNKEEVGKDVEKILDEL